MSKKLFTEVQTKWDLEDRLDKNTLGAHVAFISGKGEEGIYTQGNLYQTLPGNGEDGDILLSKDGKGSWESFNTLVLNEKTYGVSWKTNQADPDLKRIGNMTYHRTLPVQSGMKGCILNPQTKEVVYWLDEDNWKYKKGGTQLSRTDGYDGEVFVYVPEFWIKSWDGEEEKSVRISPTYIDDTWEHQEAVFVSAYRPTLMNAIPESMGYLSTLSLGSAVSIANDSIYCRGGSNDPAHDSEGPLKTMLGKPTINKTRGNFRIAARKAGKELISYRQWKNIIYWLFVIEYATFNYSKPKDDNHSPGGYRQGGLGVTYTSEVSYPGCPCGTTNIYGNNTGRVQVGTTGYYGTKYRGIECPLGDALDFVDGILITNDGVNRPKVYTTTDPSKYGDTEEFLEGMTYSGEQGKFRPYTKEYNIGSTSEVIPIYSVSAANGGSFTTYRCFTNYYDPNLSSVSVLSLGMGIRGNTYNFWPVPEDDYGASQGTRVVVNAKNVIMS